MKIERGDYVAFKNHVERLKGVVVAVVDKPVNLGQQATVVTPVGNVYRVDDWDVLCDYSGTRSDHHQWEPGQQAEYDALNAHGRRLYDQLRTRLGMGHTEARQLAESYVRK